MLMSGPDIQRSTVDPRTSDIPVLGYQPLSPHG